MASLPDQLFDMYRQILHPKKTKADQFIVALKKYYQPTTKFVRAIGNNVRTDDSLTMLKNKLLLRPQQKMKKNITIVAQISDTAIVAVQTGLVTIGPKETAYSHLYLIAKTDAGPKIDVSCFRTNNAKSDESETTKKVVAFETKYLVQLQNKQVKEQLALYNPSLRYNFINDAVVSGTAVSCLKAFCNGDLLFAQWFKDSTRFQTIPGAGGIFSITSGKCCIGEANKEKPVPFTHVFWMNSARKICIDIFRLNLS